MTSVVRMPADGRLEEEGDGKHQSGMRLSPLTRRIGCCYRKDYGQVNSRQWESTIYYFYSTTWFTWSLSELEEINMIVLCLLHTPYIQYPDSGNYAEVERLGMRRMHP